MRKVVTLAEKGLGQMFQLNFWMKPVTAHTYLIIALLKLEHLTLDLTIH
jgi:hypothetical protein